MPSLRERAEAARIAAAGRGYTVSFHGPATSAAVMRGELDGHAGRPHRAEGYRTRDEWEAYDYGWHRFHRAR